MKRIYTLLIILLALPSCGSEDGGAARIVIGTSSVLSDLNVLQYQKPYVVQVSDVDGNASPNTRVTITLKNVFYIRGEYITTGSGYVVNQVTRTVCAAEDINNNGVLDAGEDINLNGFLDPTNAAILGADSELIPTLESGFNSVVTDENGSVYFSLIYPKSEAHWSTVEITAIADVIGSESVAILTVTLPATLVDLADEEILPPGGNTSTYGLGACP